MVLSKGPESPKIATLYRPVGALRTSSDAEKYSLETFAACETVRYSEVFILKSFHVQGAGELRLPLPAEDTTKLRSVCEQAPFVPASAKLVDTSVWCCWQVDASKVSFPKAGDFLSEIIQPLAMKAVGALGTDGEGAQLEAYLYKLLFYEAGGRYSYRKYTENEKGMFATLIYSFRLKRDIKGVNLRFGTTMRRRNLTATWSVHDYRMLQIVLKIISKD